jgi:hypothetical protein
MTYSLPDEGARNWLWKYSRKNFWRVAAWIDFDDLIQDGYAAYFETRMRYPTAVQPAHIQSLFQLVFRSKIEDLVRANTKQVDDARSDLVETFDFPSMIASDLSDLRALLIKAPKKVQDAIALLHNAETLEEILKPLVKYENGKRETLNDRFTKFLGLDPKVDVVGSIRMHFNKA